MFCRWTYNYDESGDKAFCYICLKRLLREKVINIKYIELTYISHGYTDWKDATTNFTKYKQSKCHTDAVMNIVTIPKSIWGDVQKILSACTVCKG